MTTEQKCCDRPRYCRCMEHGGICQNCGFDRNKATPKKEAWETRLMDEFCVMFARAEREADTTDWVTKLEIFIAAERAEAEQRGIANERREITEAMRTLAMGFSMQHITPNMEMTATKLLGAYHEVK